MARHCIREPRYVPPVQRIGEQPDLFGGPTLSHVAERQGPPKGWQRQLQKWGRCTVIADLEAAPPSVIEPPPSPSPVFLVACVSAKLARPAPARDPHGRAPVRTPVTNSPLVCRSPLQNQTT